MFERFTVIPSIDLKGGQVVRLWRGEMARATVYGDNAALTAHGFEAAGASLIHVVDLDGAIAGEPRNLEAVKAIRAAVRCRLDVSGGLRSIASVEAVMAAGADLVSIGSAAFLDPDFLGAACARFAGRVLGSLDTRDGRLAIKGWVETSALSVTEAARRFREAGVSALIVTDISRDGTEHGVDLARMSAIAATAGVPVVASGGVASLDDISALARLHHKGVGGVISGRALYEARFTLAEAIAAAKNASGPAAQT